MVLFFQQNWSDADLGSAFVWPAQPMLLDVDIPIGVGATKSLRFPTGTVDNGVYPMTLDLTLPTDADISFYRRVSSEGSYDFLRFYIDNVQQAQYSGTVAWGLVTFPVTAGAHTFKWAYTKDSSASTGSDTAWLALVKVVLPTPPNDLGEVNIAALVSIGLSAPLTLDLSQGVVYYVRVHPATTTYTDTGTVNWTSTARLGVLPVAALADVATTPGWLMVSVSNGTPLDVVDFSIDYGATIFSVALDVAGSVIALSVPLPTLTVGAHTITATTPTLSGTTSFQVIGAPSTYPTAMPPNTAPTAVTQVAGVVKWVLQDPTSGGVNYLFPINPSKMSAPHAARVFATEHSTAPNGQPLTFEGAPVGVDWQIEGACRTQAFHDTMETFLALPRRLYLIDHLSRAWTVSLEDIKWSRLPEAYNDWAFTYQMKCIIYAGPVQL